MLRGVERKAGTMSVTGRSGLLTFGIMALLFAGAAAAIVLVQKKGPAPGAGPFAPAADSRYALQRLEEQAEEMRRAILQEDHETMADLTLPLLVEKLGGRGRFVQHLESLVA